MDAKSKERTATANIFESLTTNKNNNKIDIIASFKLLKSSRMRIKHFYSKIPKRKTTRRPETMRRSGPYVKRFTKQ